MVILLTGGTGLIGRALSLRLIEEGHTLHLLVRNVEKAKAFFPSCKVFFWDGFSSFPKEALPKDSENWGVIHLAGENIFQWPWFQKRKKSIYNSRVNLTKNLITHLSEASFPPKFFIGMSAVGIYGESENTAEEKLFHKTSSFLQNLCMNWEKEAFFSEAFTRTVIFRLGHVLSKEGGFLGRQLAFINKKCYGPLKTVKPLWISWIHIDDLIDFFLWVMNSQNAKGIYNVVSPHPVTLKEFTKVLFEKTKFKSFFPALPLSILKFIGGEMIDNIFVSSKIASSKGKSFPFKYATLEQALNHLLR